MWQEARKQEKKLRGIMIDYKKRAERRQAYYQRMKMDPHQLMRVYGQKCKFHMIGENSKVNNADGQLMPWQGDPEIMIDRFDVRAHLDFIPEINDVQSEMSEEEEKFVRKCNYERYRTLVQIDATGATEEHYLKQLEIEESYGRPELENKRKLENDKLSSKANAKFHYKYDDSSDLVEDDNDNEDGDFSDSSPSDGELSDIDINVNVLDLSEDQTNHLDALATQYGVGYGQYCKQLLLEKKEFEYVKKLEEEEEERAKMPGRKGKSARRYLRAKQKTLRGSPLSFAVHESSPADEERTNREGSSSSESSRSNSPIESKVEFITEFGGEEEANKNGSGNMLSSSNSRKKSKERSHTHHKHSRHRSSSRSRSHSKRNSYERRSRDRRRSRSRSKDRHKRHRHSRSRSRERHSRSSHSSHSSRTRYDSSNKNTHSHSTSSLDKSRSKSPKREDNYGFISRGLSLKSNDRSRSPNRSYGKDSYRRKSRSRSRSKSRERRSKSPRETIVKRLGSDASQTPVVDKSKLTPREKMKLRMQKLLNRQIKSDKKEEYKKQVAKEQETEERDMEIYEMSRMLRMREREKRERVYRSPSPKGHMPNIDASRFRYTRNKSPP